MSQNVCLRTATLEHGQSRRVGCRIIIIEFGRRNTSIMMIKADKSFVVSRWRL